MNIDQKLNNILKLVKKLKKLHPQRAKHLCQTEDKAIDASNATDDWMRECDKIIEHFPEWKPVYDTDWELITEELCDEDNYWDEYLNELEEQVDAILSAHEYLNEALHGFR
jgi:hypothetical protein